MLSHRAEMCGLTSESVSPQEGRVGRQLNHSSEDEASTQCEIPETGRDVTAHQRADLCVSWRHAVAPCRKWTMRWPVRIVSENLRCPRVSLTRKGIRNSHLLPRRRRASGKLIGISYPRDLLNMFFLVEISETVAALRVIAMFQHLTHNSYAKLCVKKCPYRKTRRRNGFFV